MVIDAMDLLYARNLDGFAIVSSDADFTPLVMRLLTDGMKVYGFGEKKTPAPFVNACSKFTYVEALGQQAAAASETAAGRKDATALRSDTRLVQMLRNAIVSACEDDGWALLSAVGKQVANQASFDPRKYGYRKLSDLVRAIGLFEIKQDEQWCARHAHGWARQTGAAGRCEGATRSSAQAPDARSSQSCSRG